jgi:hypothetical protein
MGNQIIYYLTSCKCVLKKEDTELIAIKHEDGRIIKRDGCIKHKGIVLNRKTYCTVCAIEIISGLRGPAASKCPKHLKIYHLEEMNNINKTKRKIKKKLKQITKYTDRDQYCKLYFDCKSVKPRKCQKCKRFKPIFKNVDPGKKLC